MTKKQTSLQILQDLRELLSESYSWTKGTPARDKNGKPILPLSDDACSWNLVGGLKKVVGGSILDFKESVMARDYLLSFAYSPTIFINRCLTTWQDREVCRHEDILRIIDQSIDRAKKGEKPNLPTPNRHRFRLPEIKNEGGYSQPKGDGKFHNHRAIEVDESEHD